MRKLITHLSTLIWGIGAIAALILNALGILPETALLPMLFLIVCLFVFYMVAQNWQVSNRMDAIENILRSNRDRLDSYFLEPKVLKPRIRIEDNPRNIALWSGFRNEFSFFNAPFTLAYEDLLPNFVDIFKDSGIRKVRILVFEGKTDEQVLQYRRRMERLKVFTNKLRASASEAVIREKMQVRVADESYVPVNMFFLGTRDGFSVAIMYVYPLIHGDTPQAAFEIHDEKVVNQLKAEFDRQWENSRPLSLDELFKS